MPVQAMRDAIRDAIREEMLRDEKVFILGEEVAQYNGPFKCTRDLWAEFGDKRVIDTPIAEVGFAGVACGAAFKGLRPIVDFMTWNFALLASDHILNSAAKTYYMSGGMVKCPIVFRGPNGSAIGAGAQHSQDFTSWYANVPGLKVVAPATPAEAKGLLKSAIRDNGPVCVLEHELLYGKEGEVPEGDDVTIPIGKAAIMREGKDVTIVAASFMVHRALEAAELLAAEGIEAEVVNLRSIRPLDETTILDSVRKTNRCVAVEEGWQFCGLAAEISALVTNKAFDHLDAPVERVSQADVPLPYARNLETLSLPQAAAIVAAAKKVCYV